MKYVSIHAPLARSNMELTRVIPSSRFQYMLLLRGATFRRIRNKQEWGFQYMLLLRGATGAATMDTMANAMFQYMLLLRGATSAFIEGFAASHVSIHAPLARSNWFFPFARLWMIQFQYMLLLRGATKRGVIIACIAHRFNTCSSCEEQH